MAFKRTVENFACQHCGVLVLGDGYTNHCPHCLWSRHVDKDPGDRAERCGGMMRPVALEGSSPEYRIRHVCETCAIQCVNRVHPKDSADALIALAGRPGISGGNPSVTWRRS